MRMIIDYSKALLPLLCGIALLLGGGYLFWWLVMVVPNTPLPLLGMLVFFSAIPALVFGGPASVGEFRLAYMKHTGADRIKRNTKLKSLRRNREYLIRELRDAGDSKDRVYKAICQVEMEIAETKGKPYRFPKYQPGNPSEW